MLFADLPQRPFFKAIPGVIDLRSLKVFSSSTENPIMKLPTIAEDHCVTHFGQGVPSEQR